jgi:hypothetical protein
LGATKFYESFLDVDRIPYWTIKASRPRLRDRIGPVMLANLAHEIRRRKETTSAPKCWEHEFEHGEPRLDRRKVDMRDLGLVPKSVLTRVFVCEQAHVGRAYGSPLGKKGG